MASFWDQSAGDDTLNVERVFQSSSAANVVEDADWSTRGVYGFDSRDIRSRPFNLLRSQVLKIMQANNWRILGITAGSPNVGKSFVASNLAAAMSRIPTIRTMLFDLDLRRHSVAGVFGLSGETGIESFLSGQTESVQDAAYTIGQTGLTVYPSFWSGGSSAEVLAGARFQALVKAVRALPSNVVCICDLPPAFANDDTSIVLGEIDAYLLVVEEGRSTKRNVRDTIRLLNPTPCIGTVLNRYRGGLGVSDYGFGYGAENAYSAYYG